MQTGTKDAMSQRDKRLTVYRWGIYNNLAPITDTMTPFINNQIPTLNATTTATTTAQASDPAPGMKTEVPEGERRRIF